MSLYEGVHRNFATGARPGFDYRAVYAACFAAYLIPVAVRHGAALIAGRGHPHRSVLAETSALAANCAASSFVGL